MATMKKGILPRGQWPKTLSCEGKPLAAYPQLKGIFLGGCVKRGFGSSFHAGGHAHTGWPHSDDHSERAAQWRRSFGWICLRKPERVNEHTLMMHELAHILTAGEGHNDVFRSMAKQLGGSFHPKRARPRKRTPETATYLKLRDDFQVLDREWERLRDLGRPEKEIIAFMQPRWGSARKAFHAEAERLAASAVGGRNHLGAISVPVLASTRSGVSDS